MEIEPADDRVLDFANPLGPRADFTAPACPAVTGTGTIPVDWKLAARLSRHGGVPVAGRCAQHGPLADTRSPTCSRQTALASVTHLIAVSPQDAH